MKTLQENHVSRFHCSAVLLISIVMFAHLRVGFDVSSISLNCAFLGIVPRKQRHVVTAESNDGQFGEHSNHVFSAYAKKALHFFWCNPLYCFITTSVSSL